MISAYTRPWRTPRQVAWPVSASVRKRYWWVFKFRLHAAAEDAIATVARRLDAQIQLRFTEPPEIRAGVQPLSLLRQPRQPGQRRRYVLIAVVNVSRFPNGSFTLMSRVPHGIASMPGR